MIVPLPQPQHRRLPTVPPRGVAPPGLSLGRKRSPACATVPLTGSTATSFARTSIEARISATLPSLRDLGELIRTRLRRVSTHDFDTNPQPPHVSQIACNSRPVRFLP